VVYRLGRIFSQGAVVIFCRKNKGDLTRIGIVVSTKFSKKAVERNRAKRQMRVIAGKLREKIQPGYDVVINIRKSDQKTRLESGSLEQDLLQAMQKAKIIN